MARVDPEPTLLSLLVNPIIFSQVLAHLTVAGLLNLASTSKSFQNLIQHDPTAFRTLDLSTAKGAAVSFELIDRGGEIWRSQRMDEAFTEDDFYCGPVRGIFSSLRRRGLLQHVQTLILDGQAAPADILHEIIHDDSYRVRILSVIGAKHLNEAKFRKVLTYAIRRTRPEGTPRLQGVYIFGTEQRVLPHPPDMNRLRQSDLTERASVGSSWNRRSRDVLSATLEKSSNIWYGTPSRVLPQTWSKSFQDLSSWARVIKDCEGIIAFDAVLCRGPKHWEPSTIEDLDIAHHALDPTIATITLNGCAKCGSMPEGPAYPRNAPSTRLPLLWPPPRTAANIAKAQIPTIQGRRSLDAPLFVRCHQCLISRCCDACFTFWCEDCFEDEELIARVGNQRRELLRAKENHGELDPTDVELNAPGTKVWICCRERSWTVYRCLDTDRVRALH